MKAINYLKQIKFMDSNIDIHEQELESLTALATKTTSVMGGERVQASGSQQKMADCVVKIVSLQDQITKEIDRFIDYKQDAIRMIQIACDADCIKLIHKRYFQYKTWEQIAVEMDFTYKWVSCGLHQRALSQLQKKLDDIYGKDGEKNE